MKYCTHCGKELLDEAVICPGCGTATKTYKKAVSSEKTAKNNKDKKTANSTKVEKASNSTKDEKVPNSDPAEAVSAVASVKKREKKVKSKKTRTFVIAAIAVLLIVCSAVAAILVYNATSIKGLSFDRIEDMESYSNGCYIYDEKILWIDSSTLYLCNIEDILFDANNYTDEINYKVLNPDTSIYKIYDNLALIKSYLLNTTGVELGYSLEHGILINKNNNEKLFAVQGDGKLAAFDISIKETSIERIVSGKQLEENPELKSAIEAFRSDYESAVQQATEEKQKQDFWNKYENAVDATEVQYKPSAFYKEDFILEGMAVLDYTLESEYFYIWVTPKGGSSSDKWRIYADRSENSDLYEKLLKEIIPNITIVGRGKNPQDFSERMAYLVDYIID